MVTSIQEYEGVVFSPMCNELVEHSPIGEVRTFTIPDRDLDFYEYLTKVIAYRNKHRIIIPIVRTNISKTHFDQWSDHLKELYGVVITDFVFATESPDILIRMEKVVKVYARNTGKTFEQNQRVGRIEDFEVSILNPFISRIRDTGKISMDIEEKRFQEYLSDIGVSYSEDVFDYFKQKYQVELNIVFLAKPQFPTTFRVTGSLIEESFW